MFSYVVSFSFSRFQSKADAYGDPRPVSAHSAQVYIDTRSNFRAKLVCKLTFKHLPELEKSKKCLNADFCRV